jgi:putative aldouronate transport system permease protein
MNSDIKNKTFDILVYSIVTLTVIICVLPFLHVIALSLSGNEAVMAQKVTIFPVDISFKAYIEVFSDGSMIHSLLLTIYMTVIFTVLGLLITIALAYPLSRKGFKGRGIFMLLILFTFYFNAGMIPTYINIQELGLRDNIWGLILPLVLSPYNMILMRTYLMTAIPESLEESARLDGCSHWGILLKIILPLSKPMLATLALFFAVGRWNTFQDAFMYITSRDSFPLQLRLYYLVSAAQSTEAFSAEGNANAYAPEVMKAASIMFATIPIIIVYPWLQKYFVKGVMIGAVKG